MYDKNFERQAHENTSDIKKSNWTVESIDQIVKEAEEKLERVMKEAEENLELDRKETRDQSVDQIIKKAEEKLERVMKEAEGIVEQSMNNAEKNLDLISKQKKS